MATISCEKCRTRFYWRPDYSEKPVCPNCDNDDFKLEAGKVSVAPVIKYGSSEKEILIRIEHLLEEILKVLSHG